jgi:acetoacetate decarboxylase
MAGKGRLTKDKFSTNMPVDAPLYSQPPIYYKNVEALSFTYETDEDAVLDILPEGLEVTGPAIATVLIIKYPFSTLGPYDEAILGVSCTFRGKPRFYIPHIVVHSDIPFAAGREIWGYPKKFAHITLEKEGDLIIGTMERPRGNRICTAVVRPERPLKIVETEKIPGISLRVIPNPDGSSIPSLAELIEVPPESTTIEAYSGVGFLQFNSVSTIDPWHKFKVKNLLSAVYRRYDNVLHPGKVVKKYNY